MLHRILAMLIVGFWLAMTALLVVREQYPEATRLNSVPVSHVGSLLFQHTQVSDLQIYDDGKEVGYIHILPQVEKGARSVRLQGNLAINALGGVKHRLAWGGTVSMGSKNELTRVDMTLSVQDQGTQLETKIDLATGLAQLEVRSGGHLVSQNTITLDRKGAAMLMERAGLDPALLQQITANSASAPTPELSAQTSTTRLNGESISTYLVSFKIGGQTILEAHVSQLGQIIRAQAPLLGYKLAPYNVTP